MPFSILNRLLGLYVEHFRHQMLELRFHRRDIKVAVVGKAYPVQPFCKCGCRGFLYCGLLPVERELAVVVVVEESH